jgi:hypothetical protein
VKYGNKKELTRRYTGREKKGSDSLAALRVLSRSRLHNEYSVL